jgi:hypothetical protein
MGSTNAAPQPSPVTLPPPSKTARVADMIAAVSGRHAQRPVAVFFVAASHCTTAPYVHRGWGRTGQPVKVPTPVQRQSTTRFGALHLRPQRCYWKRAMRGTSTRCRAFLHPLPQRFPEALRILRLENATMPKSRAVKRFLTPHDWGALEPLAPLFPSVSSHCTRLAVAQSQGVWGASLGHKGRRPQQGASAHLALPCGLAEVDQPL